MPDPIGRKPQVRLMIGRDGLPGKSDSAMPRWRVDICFETLDLKEAKALLETLTL